MLWSSCIQDIWGTSLSSLAFLSHIVFSVIQIYFINSFIVYCELKFRWMVMELTLCLVFSWIMAIHHGRSWGFQPKSWGHCGFLLLLTHLMAVAVALMGLCQEYSYQSYWWIRWVHKLRCVGKILNYSGSVYMHWKLHDYDGGWIPSLFFAASFEG